MSCLPPVDSFQMCATRVDKTVVIQGHYIAPSGGYVYTAKPDEWLAMPPHVLGASINMLRPQRRFPRHVTRKLLRYEIADPQAKATHVVVFLLVSGVFRYRMSLPIHNA